MNTYLGFPLGSTNASRFSSHTPLSAKYNKVENNTTHVIKQKNSAYNASLDRRKAITITSIVITSVFVYLYVLNKRNNRNNLKIKYLNSYVCN